MCLLLAMIVALSAPSTSDAQKGASVGTGRGMKDSSEQLDVRIATAAAASAPRATMAFNCDPSPQASN